MKDMGLLKRIEKYIFQSSFLKNTSIVFMLAVIPIVMVISVSFTHIINITNNEIDMVNRENIAGMGSLIDDNLKTLSSMVANISLMSDVKVFASNTKIDNEQVKKISEFLRDTFVVYPYKHSVYVYSFENKKIITEYGVYDELQEDNFDFESFGNESKMVHFIRTPKYEYPKLLTIVRPVAVNENKTIGLVILNIDMEKFGDSFFYEVNNKEQKVIVVENGDTVAYSNDSKIMFKNLKKDDEYDFLFDKSGNIKNKTIKLNGEKYALTVWNSKYLDWEYVGISSNTYNKSMSKTVLIMMTTVVLAFILVVVCSYLISIFTFRPIRNIMSFIDRDGADKSMSEGSKKIIEMTYINDDIKNKLEQQFAASNKAMIAALQSQINPHFIYNVLEVIQWKSIEITDSENAVSNMVYLLGRIMRYSLDNSAYLVSVEDEIENTRTYVEIMEKRYPDRFSVKWDVDESVKSKTMLKLSLQPIVENAICHGLIVMKEKGELKISLKCIGNKLCINISDNGVGIDKEKLNNIQNKLINCKTVSDKHIGLANVNKRIKLLFGEEYGLSVSSHKGTSVVMTIPKLDWEE